MKKTFLFVLLFIIFLLVLGYFIWQKTRGCEGLSESQCKSNNKCTSVIKPVAGSSEEVFFDHCKERTR